MRAVAKEGCLNTDKSIWLCIDPVRASIRCVFSWFFVVLHDLASSNLFIFSREGLVVGCKESRVWRIYLNDD